ncbi:MAG: ferredoxin--NADP reductase [Thermodesulfobacteriota bacterium]
MEKELAIGKIVWVKLPYSDFVVNGLSDVVLLAGGTGITAFIAFLNSLTREFPHRVYLIYGGRKRELLIYLDHIYMIRNEVPKLTVYTFVEASAESMGKNSISPYFHEFPGLISLEIVWDEIKILKKATFYLSGPPGMLKALSKQLLQKGIQPEYIRIDGWD